MKTAIITGASSGIGYDCARLFALDGYKVYALARTAEEKFNDGKLFKHENIIYRNCDVTDEDSIKAALIGIDRVDVLVNVAGYGIAGSIEFTSDSDAKKQFNTNFFGTMNMNRAVLPIMRAQEIDPKLKRRGLILITSSVMGIYPIPYQGMYTASKFALEGMAGSLKLELKSFDIAVTVIEPGDVKTGFTNQRVFTEPKDSPYYSICEKSVEKMAHDEQNGLPPESVAKLYLDAANRKRNKHAVVSGFSYKFLVFLKRLFPTRFMYWVLSKMYL